MYLWGLAVISDRMSNQRDWSTGRTQHGDKALIVSHLGVFNCQYPIIISPLLPVCFVQGLDNLDTEIDLKACQFPMQSPILDGTKPANN
jgi:hypothetical protein